MEMISLRLEETQTGLTNKIQTLKRIPPMMISGTPLKTKNLGILPPKLNMNSKFNESNSKEERSIVEPNVITKNLNT